MTCSRVNFFNIPQFSKLLAIPEIPVVHSKSKIKCVFQIMDSTKLNLIMPVYMAYIAL